LFKKHWKSLLVNWGEPVDPSQFAYESPAANLFRKHWKSLLVSSGDPVDPSQLAKQAGAGVQASTRFPVPVAVLNPPTRMVYTVPAMLSNERAD